MGNEVDESVWGDYERSSGNSLWPVSILAGRNVCWRMLLFLLSIILCSTHPWLNPLIWEVSADHYTVACHYRNTPADLFSTQHKYAALGICLDATSFSLSPISISLLHFFYMNPERRVIKSAENAWAGTSDAVSQNVCTAVHWDEEGQDEMEERE